MNCTPGTASSPRGRNTAISRRSSTSWTAGLAISGVPWRPITSVPNCPRPSMWPRCKMGDGHHVGHDGLVTTQRIGPRPQLVEQGIWWPRSRGSDRLSNSTPSATGVRRRREDRPERGNTNGRGILLGVVPRLERCPAPRPSGPPCPCEHEGPHCPCSFGRPFQSGKESCFERLRSAFALTAPLEFERPWKQHLQQHRTWPPCLNR